MKEAISLYMPEFAIFRVVYSCKLQMYSQMYRHVQDGTGAKRVFSTFVLVTRVCCVVHLSITLVDCDHIVQQKWRSAHDGIGRCLGYLHAEANPDHSILGSTEQYKQGIEKYVISNF